MTDPLVTQAERIIRAAVDDPTVPPAIVAWQAANAIVSAGWKPPPKLCACEGTGECLACLGVGDTEAYDCPAGCRDGRCPHCTPGARR